LTTTLPHRCRAGALALTAALLASSPHFASAYVAAGDRTFPAMVLLPQVAPADQLYVTPTTQPMTGGRSTDVAVNFAKTLTERLGVRFEEDFTWLGRNGASTITGWQNLQVVTQYLAVLEPAHEALLTLGVNREWGGTGARRVGASAKGATTPTVYFAKGMGDLDLGYLRPFAVTGSIGYQVATRNRGGDRTSVVFGPGVNYSGEGWEFIIEALVPAGRGAGNGLGVAAQFNLSLDYFFPDTIGKPLFSRQ